MKKSECYVERFKLGLVHSQYFQEGITLIEVPYWWNFNKESLAATIHNVRPDLISECPQAEPISALAQGRLLIVLIKCSLSDTSTDVPLSHALNWDGKASLAG